MADTERTCMPRLPGEGTRGITFVVPARVFDWITEDTTRRKTSVSEFMRWLIALERKRTDEATKGTLLPSDDSVTWPGTATGT